MHITPFGLIFFIEPNNQSNEINQLLVTREMNPLPSVANDKISSADNVRDREPMSNNFLPKYR